MAERYPDELSGGQQQRVGLARALAGDPEVMLLDEPFSALDPLIRRDMQNEVIRLHRELGKTMVFITHDLAEALKLGDHVMIMRAGKVVQIGSPEELVGAAGRRLRRGLRPGHPEEPRPDAPLDHARPAPGRRRSDGPMFPPDTIIRTALHAAAATDKPIRVMADGRVLGVVDRARILESIAGAEEPDAGAPARDAAAGMTVRSGCRRPRFVGPTRDRPGGALLRQRCSARPRSPAILLPRPGDAAP